jgi:hypothetical protein
MRDTDLSYVFHKKNIKRKAKEKAFRLQVRTVCNGNKSIEPLLGCKEREKKSEEFGHFRTKV